MKLIKHLKEFESISPIGDRQWVYRNITPKFSFTNFVYEARTQDWVVLLTIRGSFSEESVHQFLSLLNEREESIVTSKSITLFPAPIGAFTQVCIINCECHDAFKTFAKELNFRTLVTFPSYECEFVGDETPDLIRLMRRDFVSTVDWTRRPSPKLRMRYENYSTEVGSVGSEMGLVHIETLLRVIDQLDGCSGFAEIENYKRQFARIESSVGGFEITGASEEKNRSRSETITWVKKFVLDEQAFREYK